MLEQGGGVGREQLASVFLGAIAWADVQAMRGHGLGGGRSVPVILSGRPDLQPAWKQFLEREGLTLRTMTADETETAFLAGLQGIVFASPAFPSR